MSTPFHAKFFAHELSLQHNAGSIQKLTHSLFDACIDLNPHQIEAALFGMRSPLAKGAILADEVGLGKTIEAGLLLCQLWAERKRKLLIISPAALRKQWSIELMEKFHLPNMVLDARSYKQIKAKGNPNPFDNDLIVIASVHFASRYGVKLRTIDWDMVVIDEAHKLRNVYKPKNKMAHELRWALDGKNKVLLTATPLQNSLMELYGLSTFIDEHIFGDPEAFRAQFINKAGGSEELAVRLERFCKRTLRNQVTEYIRYTKRRTLTLPYEPTDNEHQLYDHISEFIAREDTYSIPHAQRHLMTLVLRKILASSIYAISGTLGLMRNRLKALLAGETIKDSEWLDQMFVNDDLEEDILDEAGAKRNGGKKLEFDPVKIADEIKELDSLIIYANSLATDTKAKTLLQALDTGFKELAKMKALRKAIIFTESRRTQEYLVQFLSENGFKDKIILFNGTNNDDISNKVYKEWLEKNKDSGRVAGSRAVDMRTAIVEYFRDHGEIMIATEAAAEGINLQFCSLLINYDLPWNPQRIEQRIGRCHRYGQKFDVVVINFLNKRNETDCRVYELLDKKFSLFEGVFGASDEVLGNLDSGVDFERRIHNIYDQCRSTEEIEEAFSQLRLELDELIQDKMADTRRTLLEHFDEEVHARFKMQLENAREQLDRYGSYFWDLSKFILNQNARFFDDSLKFNLSKSPLESVKPGNYQMISKTRSNTSGEFLYRLSHPLGEFVLAAGKNGETPPSQLYFDITNHPKKISVIERLRGKSGWIALHLLQVQSFEPEEYLIWTGLTEAGKTIDPDICEKFFLLRAASSRLKEIPPEVKRHIEISARDSIQKKVRESVNLNNSFFAQECDKLDSWADDMVIGAERALKDIKVKIKSLSRESRMTQDTLRQHQLQVEIKSQEIEKRVKRQHLFDVEDEIMAKRDKLIEKIHQRMHHEFEAKELFLIRWTVI